MCIRDSHLFRYSLEEDRLTTVCDDVRFINAIVSSNEGVVYFATESRGSVSYTHLRREDSMR